MGRIVNDWETDAVHYQPLLRRVLGGERIETMAVATLVYVLDPESTEPVEALVLIVGLASRRVV